MYPRNVSSSTKESAAQLKAEARRGNAPGDCQLSRQPTRRGHDEEEQDHQPGSQAQANAQVAEPALPLQSQGDERLPVQVATEGPGQHQNARQVDPAFQQIQQPAGDGWQEGSDRGKGDAVDDGQGYEVEQDTDYRVQAPLGTRSSRLVRPHVRRPHVASLMPVSRR